jgi:hypothetical protein
MARDTSGGPGGQHRNRVRTQTTLVHTSGIKATAGERRSAIDNKRVALKRLRLNLAVNIRTPVPAGEIGSELLRTRRGRPDKDTGLARIRVNPTHHDYPGILAEILDTIADAGWDPKTAAIRLEVTMTQLLRVIRDHAPAWQKLNTERANHGLHPLK